MIPVRASDRDSYHLDAQLKVPASPHQVGELPGRWRTERPPVPVRHHHEVTVVVRVEIENDVAGAAADQNEAVAGLTEDAIDARVRTAGRRHVGESPGGPEVF